MRHHTTGRLRVRVATTAAAVAGTCAALAGPAAAAEPGGPATAPAAYADATPDAGEAAPDSDAVPAQGGEVSHDGESGDVAPAVTVLTFLGLGAIAVAVTADKRRKSGY